MRITFRFTSAGACHARQSYRIGHRRYQGVGLQVAKALVAEGATVLVGSRNFERGQAAATEIGTGAVALQLDVTDQESIAAAADRIRSDFGRLDLLVNNAGISNTRKGDLSLAEYAKISRASNAPLVVLA